MNCKVIYISSALLFAVVTLAGCSSGKGTSSLGDVTKTTAKSNAPVVRSDQKISTTITAKQAEAKAAQERAVSEAEARAIAAGTEVMQKAAAAREKAEEEAKIRAEKVAQAKEAAEVKAKEEAAKIKEQVAQEAENVQQKVAASVAVREEAATVLSSKSSTSGQYHVIVGSFKSMDNANVLCDKAVEQGYLPSVMENADGLYRVSIYTVDDENTARAKVVDILKAHPEYTGMWLLKIKK